MRLSIALLAAFPVILSAQDPVPAKVDAVFARFAHPDSPGCILGVTRAGTLVYEKGYGMADLERDVPITPASIFHVASISKQFTAMAIMLLEQQGKLSIDDDVRKYVPELPDYGKRITLRHLLTHTSGIRDQWALLDIAGWREDDLITEDDVMWAVTRQRSLNFNPGDEYLYSNSGFTVLAVIVKRVSGQSLRAFADAQIFKPGLRCSQCCRRNIHAHESLGWNLERLRVTPFVRIECQTRLRSDYGRQCDKGADVMEQVRPRYSLHCFSWLRRETADTETTRELRLRRRQ